MLKMITYIILDSESILLQDWPPWDTCTRGSCRCSCIRKIRGRREHTESSCDRWRLWTISKNITTFGVLSEATSPGTYTNVQSGCTYRFGLCKHGFPLQHPPFPMKLCLLDRINLLAKSFRHAKKLTKQLHVTCSICFIVVEHTHM